MTQLQFHDFFFKSSNQLWDYHQGGEGEPQQGGRPGHPPDIYISGLHSMKKLAMKDNYAGHPNEELILVIHPNQGVDPRHSPKPRG